MDKLKIIKEMKVEEIIKILPSGRPDIDDKQQEAINQYKTEKHDIFDDTKREKKKVKRDTGRVDANGNPITVETLVEVARVGISFQKLIVERRIGFMLSNPIRVEARKGGDTDTEKKLIELIEDIQEDCKMEYKNKEIARRLMSELEVAEIWYYSKVKDAIAGEPAWTLKMKILSPDLGDKLYPIYDGIGDMIAFGREYTATEDKKDIEHLDVYTDELIYLYVKTDDGWKLDDSINEVTLGENGEETTRILNPAPNVMKKIPIIYYWQPNSEWADQQSLITRQEILTSNHADMNDYYGSPMLAVSGEVVGYSKKGEQGKIIELAQDAKAGYLALESKPESISMELDNVRNLIYTLSQTPDISFDKLLSIGNITGIALKMMFLDAHMAVKTKEEIYGIGVQRRINLIKAAIGALINPSMAGVARTIKLKPVFTPYLPLNLTELIDNITVCVNAGIMSTETAIETNELTPDSEKELKRLQDDKDRELKNQEASQRITMENTPDNNFND